MPSSDAILPRIPADIIVCILSHLDTIQDLGIVIRSHRIFYAVFRNAPLFIARLIIMRQISADAAPLVLALLESSKMCRADSPTSPYAILDSLARAASDPTTQAKMPILPTKLSLSDLAFCSRNYAAAESLAHSLAAEAKPAAISMMNFRHPISLHLTSSERCRLIRTFIRFQLMCNLFCQPDSDSGLVIDDDEDTVARDRVFFFSMHSPWVNEHLRCAHTWLQKILYRALDELVRHDVEWGELGVENDGDPHDNERLQHFLSCGLPFLDRVARADSYAKRARLLRLGNYQSRHFSRDPSQIFYHAFLEQHAIETIGLSNMNAPLQDWTADQLRQLAQPADSVQDSNESSSCLFWLGANAGRSIFGYRIEQDANDIDDTGLWLCGYNLWDWDWDRADQDVASLVKETKEYCNSVRSMSYSFREPGMKWDDEVEARSQQQRTDIWFAGGRGYWPMRDVPDFSRIQGLSQGSITRLLEKWADKERN